LDICPDSSGGGGGEVLVTPLAECCIHVLATVFTV